MNQISSIYSQTEPLTLKQRRPARPLDTKSVKRMAAAATERARLTALVRANGFPDCKSDVRMATLRKVLKARGVKY